MVDEGVPAVPNALAVEHNAATCARDQSAGNRSSPKHFSPALGSFAHSASPEPTGRKTVNVLRLDDDDDEIMPAPSPTPPHAHLPLSPQIQVSAARPLPRQQSLNRRGQSIPAMSITPSHVYEALGARNSPSSPEFRDTYTPDIQSSANLPNQSPPPQRRLGASRQIKGANIGARKSGAERWQWIQSSLGADVDVDGNAAEGEDSEASPTLQVLLQRQRELRGSTQIDPAIKQALYDHWTPARKRNTNNQVMDLEVVIREKLTRLIENTKSLINGPEENYSPPVKAGWVESNRKGLWGSKTVRQHVQLCMDGSFLMRKTEQPNSPVITNLSVNDIDVEADPDCSLTVRLIPHDSRHLKAPTRGVPFRLTRGHSFRSRVVLFRVNDPVSRDAWLQAFSMRKRIASQAALDKMSVQGLVSQLKLGSSNAKSAVGKATSGLLNDHRRRGLHARLRGAGALNEGDDGTFPGIPTSMSPLPRAVPECGSEISQDSEPQDILVVSGTPRQVDGAVES
jgi:hypothetical protein